jgi:hypothetical protein
VTVTDHASASLAQGSRAVSWILGAVRILNAATAKIGDFDSAQQAVRTFARIVTITTRACSAHAKRALAIDVNTEFVIDDVDTRLTALSQTQALLVRIERTGCAVHALSLID